ncbi:DUF4134 domain-containing protein [Sphingobacterium arenae]|uniref:DUF4134 domain-containing protein n=1 Tax=Sphingobacterium arenae TaxID=1280598 RepID=A0ABR7XYB0_9SPHI|nr:DUF4134 domain-containing protein [Sphingobacterium arenae]MBD1424045.1 DUF4134 domain-containing protein [Sphingobacterium arenae]
MQPIRFLIVPIFLFFTLSVSAQPGLDEFEKVTKEVNDWYFSFSDLALVIGAVCGLLGGLRVYNNWQSGKHHIDAQVMGWFFSCLFLSLVGAALKALYGVH